MWTQCGQDVECQYTAHLCGDIRYEEITHLDPYLQNDGFSTSIHGKMRGLRIVQCSARGMHPQLCLSRKTPLCEVRVALGPVKINRIN